MSTGPSQGDASLKAFIERDVEQRAAIKLKT